MGHRSMTEEAMRGFVDHQARLVMITPDDVVPVGHPIRKIRKIVDKALVELEPIFASMYSDVGRPSIPPERLIKAMLLIALYSIRSERQLCERLQYDLLFKWFVDLNIDDEVFDATTFTKNRDRLLNANVTNVLFANIVDQARKSKLLSEEHFSVDGTLLDAWASQKSVRPKDESNDDHPDLSTNNWVDFPAPSAATTPTLRSLIPKHSLPVNPTDKKRALAIAVMRSSRIAMAW